ncbi:hypothetical protein M758_11G010200 [Ceratodon purpureus]|nr:hypothetical protein M758_11G010200 [Ceratodon purpureus]
MMPTLAEPLPVFQTCTLAVVDLVVKLCIRQSSCSHCIWCDCSRAIWLGSLSLGRWKLRSALTRCFLSSQLRASSSSSSSSLWSLDFHASRALPVGVKLQNMILPSSFPCSLLASVPQTMSSVLARRICLGRPQQGYHV